MSKFVKQFRRSFKVGDVLTDGADKWRVDYIGTTLVVMTNLHWESTEGQSVFWEAVYRWRKVKQ